MSATVPAAVWDRTERSPFGIADRARFNAMWLVEHVLGEERLSGPVGRLRESLRDELDAHLARGGPATVHPVERRRDLGPAEFRARYFRRARPVVLAGFARDWPATREWSFESLTARYGDEPVCITDYGDPDFVPLAEAVARVVAGRSPTARFGGILHRRPELCDDLDLASLVRYRPRVALETSLQFFIAAAGSVTPLHADGTCNFHVQLRGQKVWRIVEPRFNPAMRPIALSAPHFKSPVAIFGQPSVDVLEAVLEPGDVLFNPSFFWHEVRYRSPSISVGVRWASPTSFLRGSPMMALLMMTARSPTVFEALVNARDARPRGFYR